MGAKVQTPAGTFRNVVRVKETSALDCASISIKNYAPGVGLIFDDVVTLVDYGYNIMGSEQ